MTEGDEKLQYGTSTTTASKINDPNAAETATGNRNVVKKRKHKHRKKQKLLRPNSPAAYPSPLPIRNEYFDQKKREIKEQTTGLSSKEDEDELWKKSSAGKNSKKGVKDNSDSAFQSFRIHYLIIHIAIMLADGLQGKC